MLNRVCVCVCVYWVCTFFFGVLDNIERSTILDRSTGVHELGLGVDVASSLLA